MNYNIEQYICYCIYKCLLTLVNKNTAVHCLFMLLHSVLPNVNKYNIWF